MAGAPGSTSPVAPRGGGFSPGSPVTSSLPGPAGPWASAAPSPFPPPAAPPAPRGSAPDTTAAATLVAPAREAGAQVTPTPTVSQPWFDPSTVTATLPGPDTPPYTVPVAPRGSAPNATAASSAGLGSLVPSIPTSQVGTAGAGRPGGAVAEQAPGSSASYPSVPLGQGSRVPTIDGLADVLAPWGAPRLDQPDELFELGDHRRSGGLPPDALGAPGERQAGARRGGVHTSHPGDGASHRLHTPAEFDVTTVRADFPILSEDVHGHQLIWFDNAATTQKPQAVIDRLAYFYAHENSNIHRAAHELAARATDAYEDARDTVRDFLGAARSEEIVFVRGATEAINLVAQSWGRKNLRAGDEILTTNLEHHANIVPWQMVAQQTGAVLKVAPVDDHGNLLLEEFTGLLGPRTKIVAATQVANAVGTVNPVATIVALAHRAGARVLIDGAQSVPHLAVDMQQLDPDFFVFSGHKVFGPTGIGVVYIAQRVWEETPAWQGGGNMIADVTIERSIYQGPPNKYEAGTGNIADAVGLGAALRYVTTIGIERIHTYEHALLEYATPRLAAIDGVRLIGTASQKASVLSFGLAGHEPEEVGKALNERGIAVRAGHHCAQPILRRLGVEKTVRPSFAFYNTREEIDTFLDAVRRLAERGVAV